MNRIMGGKSLKALCVVVAVAWQGSFFLHKTPHPPQDHFWVSRPKENFKETITIL